MDGAWMAQLCLEKFWAKWTEAGRCSKNSVGLYDYNCAKEALAPHKETTTQCSKRYNKVINAMLALWAKWTKIDSAHGRSRPCQTSPVCGSDFAGPEIDNPTVLFKLHWHQRRLSLNCFNYKKKSEVKKKQTNPADQFWLAMIALIYHTLNLLYNNTPPNFPP